MTITWYGQSCFKIDTREAVLAIDPFSKEIGLAPPRFHADIMLLTHAHPDHANAATIPGNPMVISAPGEYETRGVTMRGILTFHDAQRGRKRGPNVAFRITAEGMSVAHLGDFGEGTLREETADALGDVDVLLVPVGGTYTVDGPTAAEVVSQIEPRLVIPMHYHLAGLRVKLAPVEEFLKAAGSRDAERLEKLSLKKKDLPDAETRIVVLTKN